MSDAYTINDTPQDYDDDRFGCRLTGPDGFECQLGEPEDRTWSRDGRDAVDRLNAQHVRIAALEEGLREALRLVRTHEEGCSMYLSLDGRCNCRMTVASRLRSLLGGGQ